MKIFITGKKFNFREKDSFFKKYFWKSERSFYKEKKLLARPWQKNRRHLVWKTLPVLQLQ
jgi:hypothetical protein